MTAILPIPVVVSKLEQSHSDLGINDLNPIPTLIPQIVSMSISMTSTNMSSTSNTDTDSSNTPTPTLTPDILQIEAIVDGNDDDEGGARKLARGSQKSKSELLSVLPHQTFSESDGIMDLTFTLPIPNETQVSVKLVMDAAPGCGGLAWPAGQILSSYLTQKHLSTFSLANKSIIELGSGTGLVGLIAAKLESSCQVYITDQAPLLDIMKKNVVLNELERNIKIAELNWGEPIPDNIPSNSDIILAADCVYFEPAFPLLVETLSELSSTSTHVLFCYKKRRKADKRFFGLLKKKFTWTEVDDDPNRGIYNREAITLLKLHKIPERKTGMKQN